MSGYVYDSLPVHESLDGFWSGTIATAPATVNDPVMVLLKGFDSTHRFGPCKWVTKGTSLPQRGQDCLVIFDEQRRPYVIAWWDGTGGTAHSIGSSPPSSPVDGDEWIYNGTTGIYWRFIYDSSEATYKWKFAGGAPLLAEVIAQESTTNTAYVALTTPGPSLALPRAGDYDVEIGCRSFVDTDGKTVAMSYDIGGTGATDSDALLNWAGATLATGVTWAGNTSRLRRKTGLTAVTLTAKYRMATGGGGTGTWLHRWMRVAPVRVI